MRYAVLMAVNLKVLVCCDEFMVQFCQKIPCFGGSCFLHLQGRRVTHVYTISRKTEKVPPKCQYLPTELEESNKSKL